jgi:hypothetical protein
MTSFLVVSTIFLVVTAVEVGFFSSAGDSVGNFLSAESSVNAPSERTASSNFPNKFAS